MHRPVETSLNLFKPVFTSREVIQHANTHWIVMIYLFISMGWMILLWFLMFYLVMIVREISELQLLDTPTNLWLVHPMSEIQLQNPWILYHLLGNLHQAAMASSTSWWGVYNIISWLYIIIYRNYQSLKIRGQLQWASSLVEVSTPNRFWIT